MGNDAEMMKVGLKTLEINLTDIYSPPRRVVVDRQQKQASKKNKATTKENT